MFDLGLDVTDRYGVDGAQAGIDISAEYATDLFDQATVELLLARLERLLSAIAARPDTPISAVDMLTPQERHRLLFEINDTALPMPGATIADLVRDTADRIPDGVAIWPATAR